MMAKKKTAKKKAATRTTKRRQIETVEDTPAEPKAKRLSALDAAAQVLAKAKTPLNAKDLIAAMTAQKLWVSPGGKTPHSTLYSAIMREINTKAGRSRFRKAARGQFETTGK